MNVKELIEQADNLVGKPIDVEGELIILRDGERYVTYIYAPEQSQEEDNPHQVFIAYSIPKLKTIIRPLPFMQLIHRGKLSEPPYFWRFPIKMNAQIDMDSDNRPVIKRIFSLSLDAPYGSKYINILPHSHYLYQSEIDYEYEPEELQKHQAYAIVKTQYLMRFTESDPEGIILGADDNRYARNIVQKTITVPGHLRYIKDRQNRNHFVLRTFALRASMFSVGVLKDLSSIWWKPSDFYQVIRAHFPQQNGEDLNLQVAITGKIAYLAEQDAPYLIGGTQPKLVFTQINKILVHEAYYLR